jgi:uncharacterized membrane protein YphA (DoxX/SURF4 family)
VTIVRGTPRRPAALVPWLGTVARLLLAAVFAWAASAKITDLAASGRAVNAYQLMPYSLAKVVGAALPFIELMLALLLLAGLATRVTAALTGGLLAVYIAGIASVWARGLSIDCGCFSQGGQLAAGQHPSYLPDILRDVALLAVAIFLIRYPRTRLGLDSFLLGPAPGSNGPTDPDADDAHAGTVSRSRGGPA